MRNAVPYDNRVLLVDIEGTLADAAHRMHLRGSDWDEFYETARYDRPVASTRDVLSYLKNSHHILGITTRPADLRSPLYDWLDTFAPDIVEEVLMPPSGVFGAEEEVKIAILEDHFGNKEEVLRSVSLVLEDRDKTVVALREYGLTVWQVRQGDY